MQLTSSLALFMTLGALSACPAPVPVQPDGGDAPDASPLEVDAPDQPPLSTARAIDILFVIDNAPSMADKVATLQANLPRFMNVLETIEGGLPSVHIGVITPDLGTRGALDAQPAAAIGGGPGACSGNGQAGAFRTHASVNGSFIRDVVRTDGTRERNYTGTLSEAFVGIASVGTTGCGFEQPLEAAKLALGGSASAGFLREDALLAIIIIDDEDDCSIARTSFFSTDTTTLGPLQNFRCNRFGHVCSTGGTDSTAMNQVGDKAGCASNETSPYLTRVADYVTFFRGLKANPANVLVGVVAAPTTPYSVELRQQPGGGTAVTAVAHSCAAVGTSGYTEVADPSVRLSQFAAGFPNRATSSSICQNDYSQVLAQAAQLLRVE